MNSFWLIEEYFFANDFLRFSDRSFQKNVKSHVFWNLKKNVKYVFSNTDPGALFMPGGYRESSDPSNDEDVMTVTELAMEGSTASLVRTMS